MQNAFSQNEKLKNDDTSKEVIKKVKDKDSDTSEKLKNKSSEKVKTKRAKRKKGSQSMTSKIDENGNEVFTITEKDSLTGEIKVTEFVVDRESKGDKSSKEKKIKSKTSLEKKQ